MFDPLQTAVVTGASRGFGRAIAAALVTRGSGVVGIARNEQELAAVATSSANVLVRERPDHAGQHRPANRLR